MNWKSNWPWVFIGMILFGAAGIYFLSKRRGNPDSLAKAREAKAEKSLFAEEESLANLNGQLTPGQIADMQKGD